MIRRGTIGAVAIALAIGADGPCSGGAGLEGRRSQPGLAGAADLARIYDAILDADFDAAGSAIAGGCGPASPPPACDVMAAVATWWRIQLDPENRRFDEEFRRLADAAVASTAAWTEREPRRAEAWLYAGAAYGVRVQWRVLRGERMAAARDGARIKSALERALAIDPALHDAYVGIGLYHYYADVAPAAAKVLRWLLLLPGGDRDEGLREMLAARDRGELMRGEADYQLHLLYLWYERKPGLALDLLRGLRRRYPRNPLFLARMAEVTDVYVHDHAASLDLYRDLAEAARTHAVNAAPLAEALARLGMADQFHALHEADRAIEVLRPLAEDPSAAVADGAARAWLKIGVLEDSVGHRQEAIRAYRAAVGALGAGDPFDVRRRARAEERRRREARAVEAAGHSLEGWRALERGDLPRAGEALRRAAALRPGDSVIQYRLGHLLRAEEDGAAALDAFRAVCEARGATPPTFRAAACYEAGRIHEHAGQRALAIAMYSAAERVALADRRTRDAVIEALRRLRAIGAARIRSIDRVHRAERAAAAPHPAIRQRVHVSVPAGCARGVMMKPQNLTFFASLCLTSRISHS